MNASRGEIKIREILEEAELNFKMEYIFPDLRSPNGRPLRFDFVVFDDEEKIDFIIEYQGKQHYEPSQKFGGKRDFISNNIMIIRNEDFVLYMILI